MSRKPEGAVSGGVIWDLQRRLLVLLMLPLCLIALVSVFFLYQNAGTASLQQDQQLLRLVPLLADSVVVARPGDRPAGSNGFEDELQGGSGLALLMAPPVEEFLKAREGFAAYGVLDANGRSMLGDSWLPTVLPSTKGAEYLSVVQGGITYRVVAQRSQTAAGELIVLLADGSDARQNWLQTLVYRVLLPSLLLLLASAAAATWAVSRALRPLMRLKRAVERRSPRDLSPISTGHAPSEVRPLVSSLNRLFGMVNAQTEAQRRFVADAAHQLRTPLAGLQAQVEAWDQAARSPANAHGLHLRVDQIQRLRDATRRTTQLANQLLALSRADALAVDAQAKQVVDVQALFEDMVLRFLDTATAQQIDLGLDMAAAPPNATVKGHLWLLRELLINLLDNALKYTPAGGSVTLRCGSDGAGAAAAVWWEVEDSGPGIAPAEHGRVLQRFYRVPGSTGQGSGLGLSIADEIARAHHTHLQLQSGAHGVGLRVRLVFERAADSVARGANARPVAAEFVPK